MSGLLQRGPAPHLLSMKTPVALLHAGCTRVYDPPSTDNAPVDTIKINGDDNPQALVQCNAPAVLAPQLAHDSERLVLVSLECLRNISDVPTNCNRYDLLRALLRLFGHRNQKVIRYTLDILANLCANNKVNKLFHPLHCSVKFSIVGVVMLLEIAVSSTAVVLCEKKALWSLRKAMRSAFNRLDRLEAQYLNTMRREDHLQNFKWMNSKFSENT
ncbi:hypothetical protein COOONC_01114 [Cooperia oncophora]